MSKNGTEAVVAVRPDCDVCKHHAVPGSKPEPAVVDGRTTFGPWAYMCEAHFAAVGTGLGLGKGQRLVVRP
jgi:hypothetical protein